MMDPGPYLTGGLMPANLPIVKPNIRTGEGRRVKLRIGSTKLRDQKKKTHRKMAKKSKRTNRR